MTSTLHPPRNERADAVANRERILVAARELFAQHGTRTEMREIAERAGVGVGTLYRHFTSRDALFVALLDQTHTATVTRLHAAATVPEPEAAVRAIAQTMAAMHATFGALFEAMQTVQFPLPAPPMCAGEVHQPPDFAAMRGVIAAAIARGVAAGVFRADADIPTTVMVLTTCLGGPPGFGDSRDPVLAADALATFVLAALAPNRD